MNRRNLMIGSAAVLGASALPALPAMPAAAEASTKTLEMYIEEWLRGKKNELTMEWYRQYRREILNLERQYRRENFPRSVSRPLSEADMKLERELWIAHSRILTEAGLA